MITKPPPTRAPMTTCHHHHHHHRLHLLFRLVLVSILTLGAARVILYNLKYNLLSANNDSLFEITKRSKYTDGVPIEVYEEETVENGCNVFEGEWIWDDASYPLYGEKDCPFLVKQTTCLKNGRPDSSYQNWRWQPSGCSLPRFDGMKLKEMLRDKRLMFVGDFVQRSMFESMVCLVQSALPNDVKRSLGRIPPRKIFEVEEFNVSIEYYWAPFIIESISDNATDHTVFKCLPHTYGVGNGILEQMETALIEKGSYWGTGSSLDIMGIVEDVLGRLKVQVTVLNITQLSEYRKDGHTSVYGERKGKLLTKEQRFDSIAFTCAYLESLILGTKFCTHFSYMIIVGNDNKTVRIPST